MPLRPTGLADFPGGKSEQTGCGCRIAGAVEQLPESLLRSTGRTTMSQPLRDGIVSSGHPGWCGAHRDRTERRRRSGPPVQVERVAPRPMCHS